MFRDVNKKTEQNKTKKKKKIERKQLGCRMLFKKEMLRNQNRCENHEAEVVMLKSNIEPFF